MRLYQRTKPSDTGKKMVNRFAFLNLIQQIQVSNDCSKVRLACQPLSLNLINLCDPTQTNSYSLFYAFLGFSCQKNGLLQPVTVCYKPMCRTQIAKKYPAYSIPNQANRAFFVAERRFEHLSDVRKSAWLTAFLSL